MDPTFNATNLGFLKKNNLILKNVHFSFKPGEIICLLGNNGSGKSTLLKMCAGIVKPSCGNIMLNDKDIFNLKDTVRAKLLGWLPQNVSRSYNMTLLDFMELSPSPNTLKSLELFEMIDLQDKNISTLSGGEWKRGQLARLWQTNCKVLLLDEPDSDLDLRHKKKFVHFCKDYVQQNKGIIVIVTHDMVFASEIADKICALADGQLVWNSSRDEFWNSKIINKIFSTKVF